jgi:hypothetical protein
MVESAGNPAVSIAAQALPILARIKIMLADLRQKRLRMCPNNARGQAELTLQPLIFSDRKWAEKQINPYLELLLIVTVPVLCHCK